MQQKILLLRNTSLIRRRTSLLAYFIVYENGGGPSLCLGVPFAAIKERTESEGWW